ncbi:MAG: hypothetical protein ACLGH0_09135 [Thermoanaerobaculia bacterium]
MDTSTNPLDSAFGFGAFTPVTTPPVVVKTITNKTQLKAALDAAAGIFPPTNTVLRLSASDDYDFRNEALQTFIIRAKNVTIEAAPGQRVVLKNFGLLLALDGIDNILIQDLVFHSDGDADNARDAIKLFASERPAPPPGTPPLTTQNTNAGSVRITHCSFDGYFDISIDSRSSAVSRRLLVTIDQCLFFDARPGRPKAVGNAVPEFVNRGAINFGSLENPADRGGPQLVGNAYATVAANVFVDVWRRCPRVATGNFGHVYNNLVFRWGNGNFEDDEANKTNTWLGMAVGGGSGVVGTGVPNGTALIEANRFIPVKDKKALEKTIEINPNTKISLGSNANEFDSLDGTNRNKTLTVPAANSAAIDIATVYSNVNRTAPTVAVPTAAEWLTIVARAGPRQGTATAAETAAKKAVTDVLSPSPS